MVTSAVAAQRQGSLAAAVPPLSAAGAYAAQTPGGDTQLIGGRWQSNFGPVTLVAQPGANGVVNVTGSYQQAADKRGEIKSGSYDPKTRILEFTYWQPWSRQEGTGRLQLSADGKTLTGTWKLANNIGEWRLTGREPPPDDLTPIISSPSNWTLSLFNGAKGTLERGTDSFTVDIPTPRAFNDVQPKAGPFRLARDRWYILRFRARSDQPGGFRVAGGADLDYSASVGPEWRDHSCFVRGRDIPWTLFFPIGGNRGRMTFANFRLYSDDAALQTFLASLERSLFPVGLPRDGRLLVKPVIIVPKDVSAPPEVNVRMYRLHMRLAQREFRKQLMGKDTFGLIDQVLVLNGAHDKAYYEDFIRRQEASEPGAREVRLHDQQAGLGNRFIYVFSYYGAGWPAGAHGNGSGDANGGSVWMVNSTNKMINGSHQHLLCHELGHAFGLSHLEDYGWRRGNDIPSFVGGSEKVQTAGFSYGIQEPRLLRHELRILARNKAVFPNFEFTAQDEQKLPPDPPKP